MEAVPQYPHDSDQSDHLASLADDLEVFKPLQQKRQVKGNYCEEIDEVHRVLDEFEFVRADDESDHVLQREENHNKVIREVNDVSKPMELNIPVLILLQLLCSGDDEGHRGDQDHGKGEERKDLSQLGCPGIFNCVPQPGPPLPPARVPEVLLRRLL